MDELNHIKFLILFLLYSIQMEPCRSEIDITIVDRISAILNPQPICNSNPTINIRDAVSMQIKYKYPFMNISLILL